MNHLLARALRTNDFQDLITWVEDPAHASAASIELWRACKEVSREDAARVLSFFLVRHLSDPVAEAVRLDLLSSPPVGPTAVSNLLAGLSVLAVEHEGLPDYLFSVLAEFLTSCLEHEDLSTRMDVLVVLHALLGTSGMPERLGVAGAKLAELLDSRVSRFTEGSETEKLREVKRALMSRAPTKASIRLHAIEALVTALERLRGVEDLLQTAKVRRLRDHAQQQAIRDSRPILTYRVLDSRHADRVIGLVRSVIHFCQAAADDQVKSPWVDAPAASKSEHSRAGEHATLDAFNKFSTVAKAADGAASVEAVLAKVPGRQAEALADILLEADSHEVQLEFILTPREVGAPSAAAHVAVEKASAAWRGSLKRARDAAEARTEVYSEDVPQANTVRQVLEAVTAVLKKGGVAIEDITGISSNRQVAYYTDAAWNLGFLTREREVTADGKALKGASEKQQFHLAAIGFERSVVARAWCQWADKETVWQVDPDSATKFLEEKAIGLSGSTVPRRASTLRKWHHELTRFR